MQNPVFIFIGPPHHGKTTSRKIFCELTGIKGASTSDVIYALLADKLGLSEEKLRETPKEELRPKLIEYGDFLCGMGQLALVEGSNKDEHFMRTPSALCRVLFLTGHGVVDGVRRRLELQEFKDRLMWLGVPTVVFWVERAGHPTVEDNTQLKKEDADEIIQNDGDETKLRYNIETWVKARFKQPTG